MDPVKKDKNRLHFICWITAEMSNIMIGSVLLSFGRICGAKSLLN